MVHVHIVGLNDIPADYIASCISCTLVLSLLIDLDSDIFTKLREKITKAELSECDKNQIMRKMPEGLMIFENLLSNLTYVNKIVD